MVIPYIDQIPSDYWKRNIKISIYRDLGLCYDLLGERDKAIQSYSKDLKLCDQFEAPEWKKKCMYHNYMVKPYIKNMKH